MEVPVFYNTKKNYSCSLKDQWYHQDVYTPAIYIYIFNSERITQFLNILYQQQINDGKMSKEFNASNLQLLSIE